jgi:Ca-activated chloride channel family protein
VNGAFRFEEPLWLLCGLLAPLVLLLAWRRERAPQGVTYPGVGAASGLRRSWRLRLRLLPLLLACAGLLLASVALARPQEGMAREDVSREGVDIVVALDVSGSMAAEDFQPRNRLEVAKTVVADFTTRREHDRIGLVVFAGRALTKSPPTTDNAVLLKQLEDVRLEMLPDGTAIGSGLATSLQRLRRSQATSRIVVLVTDGANNAGEIDPRTAADLAKAMQVRVYTVCVGRGGPVPMPVQVQDPFTGQVTRRTVNVEVAIDEALLQEIAETTGGEFFRAADPEALARIFERIDALEKTLIRQQTYRRWRELYPPVLQAAAAALAAAALAWAAGLRVSPA